MNFLAQEKDGGIKMSPVTRAKFIDFLRKNPGIRLEISAVLPESNHQRRFYFGALLGLIAFYQEGMSHRKHEDIVRIHEWVKQEFNGEMVVVDGKKHVIGKTSKGRESLNKITTAVFDWLIENYNPPMEALTPEKYKLWQDTIFPYGGPENYIDYLVESGVLRSNRKVRNEGWQRPLTPVRDVNYQS